MKLTLGYALVYCWVATGNCYVPGGEGRSYFQDPRECYRIAEMAKNSFPPDMQTAHCIDRDTREVVTDAVKWGTGTYRMSNVTEDIVERELNDFIKACSTKPNSLKERRCASIVAGRTTSEIQCVAKLIQALPQETFDSSGYTFKELMEDALVSPKCRS